MTVEKPQPTPTKKDEKQNEISDEDTDLQEKLNMLVERLSENDSSVHKQSLETLRTIIKSSTTSLTSVPKPLKFMRDHYPKMKEIYESITNKEVKKLCADIVSILSIIFSENPELKYDSLKFRLLGSSDDIGAWGHEYVRHISNQITGMWNSLDLASSNLTPENQKIRKEYMKLINEIIPYLMNHNAECEAVDLCIDIEELDLIKKYTSKSNYERVCLYMSSCVAYLPDPENNKLLLCCTKIYRAFDDIGNAIRCALRMNDQDLTVEIFNFSKDFSSPDYSYIKKKETVSKQLAYVLGRHQFVQPYYEATENNEDELAEALGNTKLFEGFQSLGRQLDILDPKVPEDIYKSHLETRTGGSSGNDSRSNLAASFVNGLVNCGFGKDKLMDDEAVENTWLAKHKEYAKMNTVASLGWIMLWDVDCGFSKIDKYFYSEDNYVKAGALLGCGVTNCGVINECDPAFALLEKFVDDGTEVVSKSAIIGLGVAYAGTAKSDVINRLLPIILTEDEAKFPLACLAALSCGLIAVGTLNGDVTSTIIQTMMERTPTNSYHLRFMALGLALTCMQRQEDVEVILASLEVIPEPFRSMAHLMCDFCAYAGTGNVLKIQRLLQILSEKVETNEPKPEDKNRKAHKKKEAKGDSTPMKRPKKRSSSKADSSAKSSEPSEAMETDAKEGEEKQEKSTEEKNDFNFTAHQSFAALGVAMIAMGEDIGLDMAFRIFGHLLRFADMPVKRAIPLALALGYLSNPQLSVLDTLSKFSHDSDQELACNSILALGLVGAGTNNARLAAMLRQLAVYHSKDNNCLYMVRLAQGLTHLGKGTLTLTPYHCDRQLLRPVSLAALLILTVAWVDAKQMFHGRNENLFYFLTPAIQSRMLMTFDEELKPISVPVRVGQAVDVVGQAGRPKTLTGFQTHSTPVLLSHGERAELATEEYLPVTKLPLEGFVILAKNLEFTGKSTTA